MDDDFDEMFGSGKDIIETIQEPNDRVIYEDSQATSETVDNESNVDVKRIVKPKRIIARPQPKLDATRLTGPRGIGLLEGIFKDVKLKGKGHEKEDLDNVMNTLEHWAHRLFPKMSFDDCINKLEDLGSKRAVMTNVYRLRLDMEDPGAHIIPEDPVPLVHDPFDSLLNDRPKEPTLTEEQKARMMRNRLLAEERRAERIKAAMERKKALESQKATNSTVEPVTPNSPPDVVL